MARTSFWVLLGARLLQIAGFGLAFYGLFIATFASAVNAGLGGSGISITWLIPLVGIVLFIWGSKILHDNGVNILPH